MKVVAFLTEHAVVDRIINHLKLTFVAEKPPPTHLPYQEVLMAAGRSLIVSSSSARWRNWLQAVIDTGYLWQFIFGFKIVNGILLLIPRPVSGRRFHLLLDSGLGKTGKNRPRDRPVRPSASGSLVHLSAR